LRLRRIVTGIGRVDPHRLLDHLGRVRQCHQVVVLQVIVGVAAGDLVDLGDQLLLDVRVRADDIGEPRPRDRRPVETVREVHEDLVADGVDVQQFAGLGIRRGRQAAEQVRLLPGWAGVQAGTHQPVGRGEKLVLVTAVPLLALAPRAPGEDREVGAGLGDAQDALFGALRNGRRERVRLAVAIEQAEVVAARAAPGHLERVALHPGSRVERLIAGDRRPRGDKLLRLLLHHLELRPLVHRRVPRQHHAPDPLIVLAVADHRDAAAAGVAQLVEEVDLLDPLAELFFVPGHVIEQLGVGDDDQAPLLGGDADRVDAPEPAVVVQLRVVVVQDVEVREPLAVRHQPADRVRDLDRLAIARSRGGQGVATGRRGARWCCMNYGVQGWRRRCGARGRYLRCRARRWRLGTRWRRRRRGG
jgi:hypothetical protein